MSFQQTLIDNKANRLWCGKANAYECLVALLYCIETNNYTYKFPKYRELCDLETFMKSDSSQRFFTRPLKLVAPPHAERIFLENANCSLLVKLFVNRYDTVCINYFHSPNTLKWVSTNKYNAELLYYHNLFNASYITEVLDFVSNFKVETVFKDKLNLYKSHMTKVKGPWAEKIQQKITTLSELTNKTKDNVSNCETNNTNKVDTVDTDDTVKKLELVDHVDKQGKNYDDGFVKVVHKKNTEKWTLVKSKTKKNYKKTYSSTKPETKPETKLETKPVTKPETKLETKPENETRN